MHELSYSTTFEDYRRVIAVVDGAYPGIPGAPAPAWMRYLVRAVKKIVETLPIWISVLVFLIFAFSEVRLRLWHMLLMAVTSCAAGASAHWSVQDKSATRYIEGHIERQGSPTIRLTGEGVEVHYRTTKTFTPWTSYSSVEIVDAYLFLFYDRAANYIPIAAFSDQAELIDFTKFAAEKIAECKAD